MIAGFLVRIGAGRFEVFRVLMWSRCGRRLDLNNEMSAIPVVPEYGFMNRVNAFHGFLHTNGTLNPQLQGIDFRHDMARLEAFLPGPRRA